MPHDKDIENIPFEVEDDETLSPADSSHIYNSEHSEDLHARLMEMFTEELNIQGPNRMQMAIDEDYEDGIQRSAEEIAELNNRGQAAIVDNQIGVRLRWVRGTAERQIVDWKILPTQDGEDDLKSSQVKESVMKYIYENNKQDRANIQSFKRASGPGLGWLECAFNGDLSDDPVYTGDVSWREIVHDSRNFSDLDSNGRFIFRLRGIDLDVAYKLWPDRKDILKSSSNQYKFVDETLGDFSPLWLNTPNDEGRHESSAVFSDNVTYKRPMVWVIQAEYRIPEENVEVFQQGKFKGIVHNPEDGELQEEAERLRSTETTCENCASPVDAGESECPECGGRSPVGTLESTTMMVMRHALMTTQGLLSDQRSPYRHNKFSFTPMKGFTRARDNQSYGLTREARDPQDMINKGISKADFILGTTQIIIEASAIPKGRMGNIREQANRPDGVIVVNDGALANNRFKIDRDRALASDHLNFIEMNKSSLQNGMGVLDENIGRETNAISGKAIEARQNEGSVTTAPLFANMREAFQSHGEKVLSLAEQGYNQEKVIRLTGRKGGIEWTKINTPEWDAQLQEWRIINDISATKADFKVAERDYRETLRMAMFSQLSEMSSNLSPEIQLQLLDLVIEAGDFPNKEQLLSRVRKLNGQFDESDPEATAEAEQAESKQAEQSAQSQQVDDVLTRLEIALKEAEVAKARADITKTQQDAKSLAMKSGDQAVETGAKIVVNPEVAFAADAIEQDVDRELSPGL